MSNKPSLKGKIIRASAGFLRLTDEAFLARLNAVDKGMDGNPNFPNPPVSPTVLKSAIDGFTVSMTAALDGSRKAIADRQKKREDLTIMMKLLAHYVEGASNGDRAKFLSSGFEEASTTHAPSQPLAQPTIVKIDQGNTGQLLVTVKPVAKARHYELRYAVPGTGGTLGQWTVITLPSAKRAAAINGLTPGTTYTFQVRAFGKLGYTDWSGLLTRMCI